MLFPTLLAVLAASAFAAPQLTIVNDVVIEHASVEVKPAPAVVNNDASYAYAVDIYSPTTASTMSCLRSSSYQTVFIRGFTPAGNGVFDTNSVASIRNAYNAGLGIEVYITPQPKGNLQGYQQIDALVQGLNQNGITVRSVWIQVTSPANWPSNPTSNVNFINSMAARARQSGLTVGIYTNQYDWSQITNNWSTIGSDVLLWYWNVLGGGVNGETPANFNDFRTFGGFKAASVKQFAQAESLCSLTVNRDVYVVGIPAKKSSAFFVSDNQIVVGGLGL